MAVAGGAAGGHCVFVRRAAHANDSADHCPNNRADRGACECTNACADNDAGRGNNARHGAGACRRADACGHQARADAAHAACRCACPGG